MSVPIEVVNKMAMGGNAPANACKISMLWNWYTIDTCFIARSWHVKSRGGFAGSCIGVFFLIVASNWLHRFCRELDRLFARQCQQRTQVLQDSSDEEKVLTATHDHPFNPFVYTFSHAWLFESRQCRPTFTQHLVRCALYTVEWGLSYIIMLLFMYYNGYIIISCILGAFAGKMIFGLEEFKVDDENDRACCKI